MTTMTVSCLCSSILQMLAGGTHYVPSLRSGMKCTRQHRANGLGQAVGLVSLFQSTMRTSCFPLKFETTTVREGVPLPLLPPLPLREEMPPRGRGATLQIRYVLQNVTVFQAETLKG